MRQYVAGLPVDIFEPERHKFRAILLMTHDLWVGGWCWHDWATRLCNLGWECWAVSLRGRDPERPGDGEGTQTPDDCVTDLSRLVAAVPSPIILVAHGFGALLGLRATLHSNTLAGVLVAPTPNGKNTTDQGRTVRLLRIKYLPLILLRQAIRIRDGDFVELWLTRVGQAARQEILQGLVPESAHLVRAHFQPSTNRVWPKPDFPSLLLAGEEDRLVASEAGRALARQLGSEYSEHAGRGHWMLHEDDWETLVDHVHRWLLKSLGESILIPETRGC